MCSKERTRRLFATLSPKLRYNLSDSWALDHLVYVSHLPLNRSIEKFKAKLGISPVVGGRHIGLGTHNAVFGLGHDSYFEIICRDPDSNVEPGWMGCDFSTSCLKTFAVQPAEPCSKTNTTELERLLGAAAKRGFAHAKVQTMSRSTKAGFMIKWQIAHPELELKPLVLDGVVPFQIEWLVDEELRPCRTAPGGVILESLALEHPEPDVVQHELDALGLSDRGRLPISCGSEPRIRATLRCSDGSIIEIS